MLVLPSILREPRSFWLAESLFPPRRFSSRGIQRHLDDKNYSSSGEVVARSSLFSRSRESETSTVVWRLVSQIPWCFVSLSSHQLVNSSLQLRGSVSTFIEAVSSQFPDLLRWLLHQIEACISSRLRQIVSVEFLLPSLDADIYSNEAVKTIAKFFRLVRFSEPCSIANTFFWRIPSSL